VNSSLSVWKSCVLKQQRLAFCRNINGSFQKANRNRARRHPTRCPHRKETTGWNWNVPFSPLRSRSIKVYAWKRFNHFYHNITSQVFYVCNETRDAFTYTCGPNCLFFSLYFVLSSLFFKKKNKTNVSIFKIVLRQWWPKYVYNFSFY
jgi:hypothetical protein